MARTPTRFVGPQAFAAASTVVGSPTPVAASTKHILRHIHVSNPTGGAITFTIQIDANAGGDTAAERIFDAYSVAAGAVLDHFCYYTLEAGTEVRAHASSTSATLTINGDLVTLG